MTNEGLEHKVANWLSNEGYRLEYLTRKAFKDAELNAILSYYVENVDGKQREIDVTAFQSEKTHPLGADVVVRVLCECKYSKDNPWVMLASGLYGHLWADWSSIPQSKELHQRSGAIEQYKTDLLDCWHFGKEQPFAHSIVQAFKKDNRDAAFESLQKITHAAWDCAETPQRRHQPNVFVMVIPCLVVESPLFFASFDYKKNAFVTNAVPYGRLSWAGCRDATVVDVIHVSALPDYAKAIKKTFGKMLKVAGELLKD